MATKKAPIGVSPSTFTIPMLAQIDLKDQVERWRYHFKNLYHIDPDFSNLYIPTRIPGFDRLIIVPKGLTHQKWVETARTIHEVDLYKENLDSTVTKNDRTPKDRSYGVWIRDRCEADEELKGKSADDLEQLKVQGITLLERLVLGTGYLFEKMSHMDRENVTLCSGSGFWVGGVPSVSWFTVNFKVYVRWCSVSCSSLGLRTRAVVS